VSRVPQPSGRRQDASLACQSYRGHFLEVAPTGADSSIEAFSPGASSGMRLESLHPWHVHPSMMRILAKPGIMGTVARLREGSHRCE
jgi:hypothetical protein